MVQRLLQRLIEQSPAGHRPLEAEEIDQMLRSAGPLDLDGYRVFSELGSAAKYGRNRVALREEFELVVICWRPGQASDIHDHGQSLCGYLVVEGEMTEEVFRSEDGLTARKTDRRRYGSGQIAIAEGRHLHRIQNDADSDLVTVHLYTPPMGESSKVYEEAEAAASRGEARTSKVSVDP